MRLGTRLGYALALACARVMHEGGTMSVSGECGYCGKAITPSPWLPLECGKCHGLFHLDCLRGSSRPRPALMGDQLFLFTCTSCDPMGKEHCTRPNLQWVHVLQLVLYNLKMGEEGERGKGFFRWNEDICGFIQTNWDALMPHRKRTQSWHSTVAGALSVNCPDIFVSGFKELGAHGWWSLATCTPPDSRAILGGLMDGKPPGKRCMQLMDVSAVKRPRLAEDSLSPSQPGTPTPHWKPSLSPGPPDPLQPMNETQEKALIEHMERYPQGIKSCSKAARLLRKLKVQSQQRCNGLRPFDLDNYIRQSLTQTVKYVVDTCKPYYEQIRPMRLEHAAEDEAVLQTCNRLPPSHVSVVLSRFSLNPILTRPLPHCPASFVEHLRGEGSRCESITSPYTARVLRPYILSTSELRPKKVQLLEDLVDQYRRKHGTDEVPEYTRKTIDLCYLQESHLKSVNSFISQFFWPVDLSECLLYPDFTVVALYGKLVVGCGCMTPDVKVNEAYLSFLVTHPDFSRAGIASLMLYHLTQTCMGKDITLHVSIDNPAMILYQKFGFKAEQYCLDFYQRYYPADHHLSHHAYYMRLRR